MKPVILIDNGHGIETPGKRSPDAVKNITASPYYFREYLWAREVAQRVCDCLQALGYDARLLVPETRDISLAERCQRANAICKNNGNGNVLLVSIHNNASGKGTEWMSARGWSIYTTKGVTDSDTLAEEIFQIAREEFIKPLKVRANSQQEGEHDYEENFYILRHSLCPAVLIENFFQDNKEDVAYIKSDQGKGACIHVIVQGVENYITKYKSGTRVRNR